MSESSVEVVREHLAAFPADPPRALSFFDTHLVWDGSRTGGAEDVTYGPGSLDAFARGYRGAFEAYDYRVERLEDLGAGAVLAVVKETGVGKTSGVPVKRSFAALYTVIDRKIVRITMFPTEQAAFEAVGQSE